MQERIWTVSNLISLTRVVLVVPAAYWLTMDDTSSRLWALVFLVAAILSDFLDGYFARRLHQVSELGKIIDPLADKVAVAIIAFVLVTTESIPLWYVLVVVLRDLLIVAGSFMVRKKKHIILQSNWPGKIAVTVIALYLWFSALGMEVLEPLRQVLLWVSVVFMVVSLVVYSRRLVVGRVLESQGQHGTV
jgi:CDP-diacylglycerol--glycerol-3-phosphate 3-phosphatidyltransferase